MEPTWPTPFSADVVRPVFGSLSNYTVALEAWRRGLRVTLTPGKFRQCWIKAPRSRSVKFTGSRPSWTSAQALRLANDKHETCQALRRAGYPVPDSVLINADRDSVGDLINSAERVGYPVVLKPLDGRAGTGVFTNIQSEADLQNYYAHLVTELGYTKIVLESHENGDEDLRILVIGDRVAAVTLRIAANVTGDGLHTIDELIDKKNALRTENPFLSSGLIKRDNEVLNYVDSSGYTLESVLAEGETIRLRGKSSGSTGGDSLDVTDKLPDNIKDQVVGAVHAIPGLYAAGVDILFDRNAETVEGSYTIIEINGTPQIGLNMYPMEGQGQDVPRIWIDTCFPESQRSELPGEDTLTFSLEEPLHALRSGAATAVTLAPIPKTRLPYRRVYEFTSDSSLTEHQRNGLLSRASRMEISGELQRTGERYLLYIASENEETGQAFVRRVSQLLSTQPPSPSTWTGVVRLGFRSHC